MSAIHVPPSWKIPERLATPESIYLDRRRLLRTFGLGAIGLSLPQGCVRTMAEPPDSAGKTRPALGSSHAEKFPARRNPAFVLGGDRSVTPEGISAQYNNFYEFTTVKEKVWELAQGYPVEPWQIRVHGLVRKPRTIDIDDIVTLRPLEERLYRFRCVERWAAQVPWTGYPLRELVDFLEPLPSARYVRFGTVHDKKGMPGIRQQRWYPWPYYEALRLDEARHELALVTLGSYGHALPMQHGAPWRVIVPWKYGYKSPKSLVEIEFTKKKPHTFWNDVQPSEYGFYSNVEPHKPHPRWSQQWEKDIGTGVARKSLLYNGYAEDVGSLYNGKEV